MTLIMISSYVPEARSWNSKMFGPERINMVMRQKLIPIAANGDVKAVLSVRLV
jgi:hypothetical protein